MAPLRGLARKELALQSRHRLNLFHRMLVGPAVSAGTVAVIFHGVAREGGAAIAGIPIDSINLHLVAGLLIHTCLNTGFYSLSEKMRNEWIGRTLALYWLAPINRFALCLGVLAPECLRLALLSLLALGAAVALGKIPLSTFVLAPFALALAFLIGLGLGAIRSIAWLSNEGRAEILDNAYLAFVFSACLYFPREILPRWARWLADANPAYHAAHALRAPLEGSLSWILATGGAALLIILAGALFRSQEERLAERA